MAWSRMNHFCRTNNTLIWYLCCKLHSRGLQECVTLRWSCDLHSGNLLNKMCRIVNVCQRHNGRTISNSDPSRKNGSGEKDNEESSKLSFLEAKKRGFLGARRRLSPFQRVADLMKEQKLPTKEISQDFGESAENSSKLVFENDDEGRETGVEKIMDKIKDTNNSTVEQDCQSTAIRTASRHLPNCKPSMPLSHGEFVIVLGEASKKSSIRVLIRLHKASAFDCRLGRIPHSDVIGRPAGRVFKTHLGYPLVIRRPSLEEYVLLMKRSPAILYPKDASAILTMADVSAGDVVLEAGTGSGAMTLFLSKAVGSTGHVLTFDTREDHQDTGFRNWRKWKASWNITHPDNKWPDNVSFHNTALQHCHETVQDNTIDVVILDVGSAGHLMPVISRKLKPGKAVVVYLPQITQTVDLLDTIRLHSVPLTIESVMEVSHRSWLVKEADIFDADLDMAESEQGENIHEGNPAETTPKYLCRPQHNQFSHTGFLVLLRKVVQPTADEE
ncbi:tRNA (adenine(58)-N(1))-methyltransferase, mitochondrial-like [Amphiura filiformis]|uniref:tRNA (adenine(58)-N(1))-methyltransferase, mitochondrial-like n=1 Tax=Amphiura filiformis TaxID=82378 RepID=UPI003B2178A2